MNFDIDEEAAKVVDTWFSNTMAGTVKGVVGHSDKEWGQLKAAIATTLRRCADVERAACANVADEHECQTYSECCRCQSDIAQAIRQRGT